mgnify:CR=1 FL=1|tara:strand:- start:204 stop:800 length:597 start_codon:yes stop_codon:yes gene_type:complete
MIKKELDIPFSFCMGGYYIDPKICDNLLDFYEENKSKSLPGVIHKLKEGKKDIVVDKEVKDSNDLQMPSEFHEGPVGDWKNSLAACLKSYENKYEGVYEQKRFHIKENFGIQKYPIGGGYKQWHFENYADLNRLFAFMTYLNDVPDGGTEFLYQNMTIKAEKGLTLIWPSAWTHTHRGVVSNTKEKYIITGWYSISNE